MRHATANTKGARHAKGVQPTVTSATRRVGQMNARPFDELIAMACGCLTSPRFDIATAGSHVADYAGLYAVYGGSDTWSELSLGNPPDGRPLYVGKAERSLVTRDLDTHFRTGRTGQSTVRRSLAALLRGKLGLRGLPRNQKKPERLANFALSPEHDAALDAWMTTRIQLAIWVKPTACEDLEAVEVGVLTRWHPPLNLKNNQSPWRKYVEAARTVMADDARAFCAKRGLSVKKQKGRGKLG